MDRLIEEKFVRTFIEKPAQDRLLFELFSKNKRIDAAHRFAHNADNIINPKYIAERSPRLTYAEIKTSISKYFDINNNCYIITENQYDGTFEPFDKALQIAMDNMSPSIVICGENAAFIKTETSIGSPVKFIIRRTNGAGGRQA
ncbi:MAG: hypothetical protein LBQ40_05715 [Clostridiales bacterium]|jgi:hypothetical protein|nr:hypothetical protein [Clostridiales bacterium]